MSMALAQNMKKTAETVEWRGYVKVLIVEEELSKCMRNFLGLAYLLSPGLGQMKIVAPHFHGDTT